MVLCSSRDTLKMAQYLCLRAMLDSGIDEASVRPADRPGNLDEDGASGQRPYPHRSSAVKVVLTMTIALTLGPTPAQAAEQREFTGAEYLFGLEYQDRRVSTDLFLVVRDLLRQSRCFQGMTAKERVALGGHASVTAGYAAWLRERPEEQGRGYHESLVPFLKQYYRCG